MRTAIFLGLIILADSIGEIKMGARIASGILGFAFMVFDTTDFFEDKK